MVGGEREDKWVHHPLLFSPPTTSNQGCSLIAFWAKSGNIEIDSLMGVLRLVHARTRSRGAGRGGGGRSKLA